MRPHELVAALKMYADGMAQAATNTDIPTANRARLNWGSAALLESANLIEQLQARLVRQAMYFETIEASEEPRWPLLDDDDAGAAI
jgi:Fe-S cluster assembly scaffold protein SufB